MTDDRKPLSPRHDRFVAEYLKDLNATQAYIRAGYAQRGAQGNASKLLHQPHIQAAIAAGQQRIARALEVTVERMAQEYATIAFANVDDFIAVDDDGRIRIDLSKASRAQRAGLVELTVSEHGKERVQRVKIKLGKLQALSALMKHVGVLVQKPAPGPTAEERQRYEEQCAAYRRLLDHQEEEHRRLERELREARQALAAVEARLSVAGVDTPTFERSEHAPPPEPPATAYGPEGMPYEQSTKPILLQRLRLPGEAAPPPVRYVPGDPLPPDVVWPGQSPYREPTWSEILERR